MKSAILICLLVFVFYVSAIALGQADNRTGNGNVDQSGEVNPELAAREQHKTDEPQSTQVQSEKGAGGEKSNTKPPEKVFRPTEEISEDLPVPFPVDI